MRIVVTGASGNVGTALLRRLTRLGVHDVVGVVRRPPRPVGVYEHVRWHSIDLAADDAAAQLRPVFDGADAVVHLAWGFQPTRNVDYLHRVGVGGTTAVLDAADATSVGQLLHMSSVGTYAAGRYGQRIDESWPTSGIPSSPYSRHKSEAEAVLDEYESDRGEGGVPIARMRPGFIVQRAAASGLMRYALPGFLPTLAVPLLPVLPVDRALCIPLVHADDVAAAVLSAVERKATGAFNLAADPPLTRDGVAKVMHAKPIHIPSGLLGTLVDLSWRTRVQPIDRGWLDMAFTVPLLNCARARAELDWRPQWSSMAALSDVLTGVAQQAYAESPPLRRRSMLEQLRRDLTDGQLTTRHLP
ncbi:epimerase [Mycolicibacterium duvalii]|uniref:NAD-dependent epimerase n=1 Tax=Mycolicibacterium duvalii TaxID=39688 RepID=A0A7I7K6X1_9MYCO|nr:NAD-dependent epimerase/dehydratase family protein [Mycolicibacterium duvalii]MCV7368940.1 NAD-dependent epimerase/dehydratase family protein [Mycolicibacterium duvalii]PEG44426.1 epimerase [Mycolicibacterium duvalii]BBX19162.1 NAD-dependent epimerase [Mycolicibacterium duvalii]